MRIVSVKEINEIEEISKSEFGLNEELMLENIGSKGAYQISRLFDFTELNSEILFFIGKGSNGADGVAIARHLANSGVRCRVFVLFSEQECSDSLNQQLKMARAYGVFVNYADTLGQIHSYFEELRPKVIVDALFGTGVQLPLSNLMYEVIDYINGHSQSIVSIDIPSGVDADTGVVQGNSIQADYTLAVGFPKLGHYMAQGQRSTGKLEVLSVMHPKKFLHEGDKFLLRPEHMVDLVNPRDAFGDKKVFGHCLVLGGSHGLTGAPSLAALASLKAGSGLVTVATWEPQYQDLLTRLAPEIMTGYIPLDTKKWGRLIKDLNKYSSIVIGPGLARSARARKLVLEILNNFDGPVVIDADAINVLNYKEDKAVFKLRNAPTVLTPHVGEFCKLTKLDEQVVLQNPLEHLKKLVDSINCAVILKGPCTYLGCTDGSVYFNYYPNDGMATAGAGDVLAGILGGLLGQEGKMNEKIPLVQKYENFHRILAVSIYLHSVAGKFAADNFGVRSMSAQSLISQFPKAFSDLNADFEKVIKGR